MRMSQSDPSLCEEAWRIVRGKILRAPNWASLGVTGASQSQDLGLERRKMEGWPRELMVKGAFQVT